MQPALDKILFLDIETVPQAATYEELPENIAHLWDEKAAQLQAKSPEKYAESITPKEIFAKAAGIYSEFGKIVCISVGYIFYDKEKNKHFRSKSFYGDDEKTILMNFSVLVNKFFTSKENTFCGHNIKEFDIPYICRRMLINRLPIPFAMDLSGKKPWEVNFLDTLEMWKFGDYKNYTSLKLLTAIFDIPTPKDDIDGSQVAEVYHKEKNIQRIATYCEKDVLATAQLLLRFCNEDLISTQNIEHAT